MVATLSARPDRHGTRLLGERLGQNNADNEISTAAVVANADGSVLERLEYVQVAANTQTSLDGTNTNYFTPHYGYHVTKVGDIATVGALDNLFDIVGGVIVTLMVGAVTSVVATSTSLQLISSVGSRILCVSTEIITEISGTLYILTGDIDDVLTGTAQNLVGTAIEKTGVRTELFLKDNKIVQKVDAAGTGLVQWDIWYIPVGAYATNSVAASA